MIDENVATRITEGFLKGTFDVVDAILGVASSHEKPAIRGITAGEFTDLSGQFPVAMHAKVKTGGAVALMMTAQDAARLASLVLTGKATAKDSLDQADLDSLKEIADPCLGGGISNLHEMTGVELALLELEVVSGDATELAARLGESATVALFHFAIPPDLDGQGALVLADGVEALVTGALRPSGAGGATEGRESEIHNVSINQEKIMTNPSSSASNKPTEPLPANMDMILDIRLMATARLGHIEMPIKDILALGPGSIFEVGRTVDEPIDLLVNDKLIARGDVVVVDEKFGVRITEIVSTRERIESLR